MAIFNCYVSSPEGNQTWAVWETKQTYDFTVRFWQNNSMISCGSSLKSTWAKLGWVNGCPEAAGGRVIIHYSPVPIIDFDPFPCVYCVL